MMMARMVEMMMVRMVVMITLVEEWTRVCDRHATLAPECSSPLAWQSQPPGKLGADPRSRWGARRAVTPRRNGPKGRQLGGARASGEDCAKGPRPATS